jgi:hypothetical protein
LSRDQSGDVFHRIADRLKTLSAKLTTEVRTEAEQLLVALE